MCRSSCVKLSLQTVLIRESARCIIHVYNMHTYIAYKNIEFHLLSFTSSYCVITHSKLC